MNRIGWMACCVLAACGPASSPEPPAVVPWPATTEGWDAALIRALEDEKRAVEADPSNANLWLELGMTYEAHVKYEYAEGAYAEAARVGRDDPKAWYRLAIMRARGVDIAGAVAAFDRVHELEPDYGPAYRRRAQMLLGSGDLDAARDAFARAVECDGADVASRLGLVEIELEYGRSAEALEMLAGMGDVPRGSLALFHRLRGTALSRLGRHDEAARDLELGQGARSRGNDPWSRGINDKKVGDSVLLLRADRLIESGQFPAALQLLDELEQRDPDDARIFTRRGGALARMGRWPDAAAALGRASDLDESDPSAALAAASAYREARDLTTSLRFADRSVALAPKDETAIAIRALVLIGLGRMDDARKDVKQLEIVAPQYEALDALRREVGIDTNGEGGQ